MFFPAFIGDDRLKMLPLLSRWLERSACRSMELISASTTGEIVIWVIRLIYSAGKCLCSVVFPSHVTFNFTLRWVSVTSASAAALRVPSAVVPVWLGEAPDPSRFVSIKYLQSSRTVFFNTHTQKSICSRPSQPVYGVINSPRGSNSLH